MGRCFLEGSSLQGRPLKIGLHRMHVVNKGRYTEMTECGVFRRQWIIQLFHCKAGCCC